jgi:hypothetical protein
MFPLKWRFGGITNHILGAPKYHNMQVWCMISQYIPINIPSLSPLLLVNNTLPLLLVRWLALEAGVYGAAMFLQAPAPKRGGNCWQNWRFRKLKMLRWSMHLVACVFVLQFNPMSKLSWCEVSKYMPDGLWWDVWTTSGMSSTSEKFAASHRLPWFVWCQL